MPHVVRKRLATDRLVPEMAQLCRRWRPRFVVGIEATDFPIASYDPAEWHPGIPAVKPLFPESKGKLMRATPAIIRRRPGKSSCRSRSRGRGTSSPSW